MRIFASGWSDNKDGPGLRYIIYCKGCNLNCCYCGNPESINAGLEIMHYADRTSLVDLSKCCNHKLNCQNCQTFECVKIFHHPQMELAGEDLSVAEIFDKIKKIHLYLFLP
jgi:pyruvate formate lyase activating enzyme